MVGGRDGGREGERLIHVWKLAVPETPNKLPSCSQISFPVPELLAVSQLKSNTPCPDSLWRSHQRAHQVVTSAKATTQMQKALLLMDLTFRRWWCRLPLASCDGQLWWLVSDDDVTFNSWCWWRRLSLAGDDDGAGFHWMVWAFTGLLPNVYRKNAV